MTSTQSVAAPKKQVKKRPERRAGLLMHPTSLPGPFGIGDLGPMAHRFVEVLQGTGQSLWQILPLTPTSYGDSPYFSPSAFAGNPLLISPELLVQEGWLATSDLVAVGGDPAHIDFGAVTQAKGALLAKAYGAFKPKAGADFEAFVAREKDWLEEFALFMAIKEAHDGRAWHEWEPALAGREPAALEAARKQHADRIGYHRFVQYAFERQWLALKNNANQAGITLVGDAPIFVAHDSADVWANPDQFRLRPDHQPSVVAGVPPDYFSATGQLWGNPHYDWDRMKATGYAWWIARLKKLLRWVDLIRIDHFRGFAAFWEIPFGEPTAVRGKWVTGPGVGFFEAIRDALGGLPLIAEDLGVLTPDVVELRDRFDLPGMKILQFAFDSAEENDYLPHTFTRNAVVYTGTHDNDTTWGWYEKAKLADRNYFAEYCGAGSALREPHWEMIRLALASVADTAVIPVQDLLGLGSQARMNTPGVLGGNWGWRLREGQLDPGVLTRLARLTELYGR